MRCVSVEHYPIATGVTSTLLAYRGGVEPRSTSRVRAASERHRQRHLTEAQTCRGTRPRGHCSDQIRNPSSTTPYPAKCAAKSASAVPHNDALSGLSARGRSADSGRFVTCPLPGVGWHPRRLASPSNMGRWPARSRAVLALVPRGPATLPKWAAFGAAPDTACWRSATLESLECERVW